MSTDVLENGQANPFAKAKRLNLGGGPVHLSGFENIDRKNGHEVYPLECPDNSIEEIVASHVLEHFGHKDVGTVLKHWFDKLKPGGKIRLAVPDFEEIVDLYKAGAPVNVQGYVMGGQVDKNDFHGCIFDREALTELMITVGFERIGGWVSDIPGCSSGPHTLNLQGFKPTSDEKTCKGVIACMSTPRFGPLLHPRCAEKAFYALGIKGQSGQSCYWAQKISDLMYEASEDPECEYVLTLDFDTVFCAADVLELYRLMKACPDVDAIFPLQSKRGCQQALFSIGGSKDGRIKAAIAEEELMRHLLPANTGHFGLTIFRASSLRKFPHPWMVPEPSREGRWDGGHTDADINFWQRFIKAGFKCCLAPRVVVGHLEHVVSWPGKDLKPIFQREDDYAEVGIPAEVVR